MATKSFLEFLDSPDIRRYHRNTAFTPAACCAIFLGGVRGGSGTPYLSGFSGGRFGVCDTDAGGIGKAV